MTAGEYLVYPMAGHRGLQFESRLLARFPTKPQAIQAAIAVAGATSAEGGTSVLVEAPGGERYPIWSSAKDGYVSAA